MILKELCVRIWHEQVHRGARCKRQGLNEHFKAVQTIIARTVHVLETQQKLHVEHEPVMVLADRERGRCTVPRPLADCVPLRGQVRSANSVWDQKGQ